MNMDSRPVDIMALTATIKQESQVVDRLLKEISRVVVGQREMLEGVVMGLLTGGHVLLEGVPGLAKTLTISTLARCISLGFNRIQFTPDLLPTDLIGTMVFNPKSGDFSVKKGPIFANIVLADEINRAPAKVQSALLEAMGEKQVTIGETSYLLENPFLVLATQNPIEQEGTYPLPEAQMDRFMFKLFVQYPNREEELEIIQRMATGAKPEVTSVLSRENLLRASQMVEQVFVDEKLKNYIVDIVMATRVPKDFGLSKLGHLIQVGCSPRASLSLVKAAKAKAFLAGRGFATSDDVKAIAHPVLRHRILLSFEAQAENMTSDEIVREILTASEVR